MEDAMRSNTLSRLPDQIEIEHGPRKLLAHLFLAADRAARDRGVRLHLRHDFDAFVAFNESARGGAYRLGIFHPDYSRLDAANAYWIEGRDAAGNVVATQAGRFFRWEGTDLEAELCSLRMFYTDPTASAGDGEQCFIHAPSGRRIRGHVAYSGGGWYHPTFRGRGLSSILPRISRAYALARWGTEYTISFVEDVLVKKGVVGRYGYSNIEPGIGFRRTLMGDMDLNLVWMDRPELLRDAAAFLSLFEGGRGADQADRAHQPIPA
jgi:hypothetical protein